MRRRDRFRAVFWRADRLLSLAGLALPLLAALALGFVWLAEHGWLLRFIIASLAVSGGLAGLRLGLRWWSRRRAGAGDEGAAERPEDFRVDANPEWTAREAEAFRAARRLIRERTARPVEWESLPELAMEVVTLVAERSGPEGKKPLDFTVPEALLLIEEVTSRFRADLRRLVPFSDSVSLSTLDWLWRHKSWALRGYDWGYKAWRVARMVKNAPAAVLREIEGAVSGGHSSFLTAEAMAVVQGLLLEEVARAAVDLYSGRLRFSEAELLAFRLSYGDTDRARLATPDAPIRIVVAGQVSAGKSSLVNALLGGEAAETDASPTTDRATAREAEIEGMACMLIDLPGLDGGSTARAAVLDEMAGADLLLWVVRADRPAREIDRAVLAEWRATLADTPERRAPPLLPVATGMDTLLPGWPYPEHRVPPAEGAKIAEALARIAAEIGTELPVPVSTLEPEWNIDTLRGRIGALMGEALMVQRNRARLEGSQASLRREAGRAGRGLGTGVGSLGRRLVQRRLPDED